MIDNLQVTGRPKRHMPFAQSFPSLRGQSYFEIHRPDSSVAAVHGSD